MIQKRGVSPVVATVLLVVMVIVLALIIFLWFRGLTKESITKFGGTNIELVCDDVSFSADYSFGTLTISNVGNVPIFGMNVKIVRSGSHETKEIKVLSTLWPATGLKQGGIFSSDLQFSGATEIVLIPILVGSSESGEKTHVCEERQGQELVL
ncbi:hypothetical protein J4422_04315 [Candidatus Pacearchaeota archaeon]|nr:hypothetical protein [Candidatus Pacearchaeota archaeon]